MNFEFNQEQMLLRDSVLAASQQLNKQHSFADRWKQIAQSGIIGTCVSKEYGGSELGAQEMLIVLESLAQGNSDNGFSFAIAAHTLSCVIPIAKFGTPEQKEKFLPSLINGEMIAANAMTESESGSDAFIMNCVATEDNGNYRLNGIKTFISNSTPSTLVLTYATTDKGKGFFGGITAFMVEKKNYKIGVEFKKMGLESCSLGEIHFNDTIISKQAILGKPGGGAYIFNHSMEWERICLAGIHLGAMNRVLAKTIEFVTTRKSAGQPISKYQAISHTVAEMKVILEVSRSYAYKAAWMLDHKKDIGESAAITKLVVSNGVKDFMLKALQVFGGYGYITEYGIEKEVRDALAATIYSGTSEIQKNIIASHLGI